MGVPSEKKDPSRRPPLAGWARRADGELCHEHTPPPTVHHAHLFDENNVFYPFRDEGPQPVVVRESADENAQVMSLIPLLIIYATSFEATSDDVDNMEFAYDAYIASNKCNTASQIIRYSRRADKLRSLRNVVDLDSHVKSTGNRVIFSTPEPLPHTFYLPRRPSGNNRRVIAMRALEVAFKQPVLLKLTAAYFLAIGLLREQVGTLGDLHGKWFLSFKVSNRNFKTSLRRRGTMRIDSCCLPTGTITHVIRATPRYKHGNDSGYSARYDRVFVHNCAPMGKYHKHVTFKDRA
ncbi:BQ5605_C007g04833 [Microbotryum silenes-dioicae]|uniref:BQ5605_C007g04833 protein n=1 Tax=Microbotryum silenes-dioicae TaxID=796604 RepID=A0A2X0PA65_9BASI|nr:BQ5605_C007g04833 [Microbotryum silenes-dioicae]